VTTRKNKAADAANKAVAAWNAAHPAGTAVILTDDFGQEHPTRTRSEAWVVSGDTAVVAVEGRSGGYLLDRIREAPHA
jgi:hypothetical protein